MSVRPTDSALVSDNFDNRRTPTVGKKQEIPHIERSSEIRVRLLSPPSGLPALRVICQRPEQHNIFEVANLASFCPALAGKSAQFCKTALYF